MFHKVGIGKDGKGRSLAAQRKPDLETRGSDVKLRELPGGHTQAGTILDTHCMLPWAQSGHLLWVLGSPMLPD